MRRRSLILALIAASVAGGPCSRGNIAWPVWTPGLLGAEQVGWQVVHGRMRPLRRFRALQPPLHADTVRAAMGGALIGIGKRNKKLNKAAIKVAKGIGPIDYGETSCEPLDVLKHLTSDY